MQEERRRHRFRAWDTKLKRLYPVISLSRGGVVLQDDKEVKTCTTEQVVLMQYTGLRDSYNQEIYEADVIEPDDAGEQYIVTLNEGAFRLKAKNGNSLDGAVLDRQSIKRHKLRVARNIYQNN